MLNRLRRRIAQHNVRLAAGRLQRFAGGAEVQEILRLARMSFLEMQAAWDRSDLGAMGKMAAEPLLRDLANQLQLRGPGLNRTEVVKLDARLLVFEDLSEALVAGVEFSGLIRETGEAPACAFRELWLLANVKATGRGWQLAQVQSLS